ncbi:MAG: PsiF family protein [Pseudomonadota bacterium]|nr:phosphate starvation-inducible protein PsiF [Gammaproteobacteria bacterium]MBU1732042.1 phosphate starvation-inducible protein PsiF [Gammaproteobacteria bacterium]MBU1894083.1 phosphate starvation-inducible protein PsiF [Gammaproteobacteria bacterium]
MKKLIIAGIALLLSSPLAFAGPQQEKMKECNASAKTQELKGDARKAFMKDCLSAKKPEETGAKSAQQNKMKQCNQEAGDKALKGNERKKFMSDCLKS